MNIADESGGAISIDSTVNTTIANSTFHKNRAKTGGAIYLAYSRNASISNSTFNENNVTENGGAIYSDFAVNCLIDNCGFEGNQALLNGGAFAWVYSYGNITNNNFKRNKATGNGDALFISIANTTTMIRNQVLSNCNFTSNHATGDGGAILTMTFT